MLDRDFAFVQNAEAEQYEPDPHFERVGVFVQYHARLDFNRDQFDVFHENFGGVLRVSDGGDHVFHVQHSLQIPILFVRQRNPAKQHKLEPATTNAQKMFLHDQVRRFLCNRGCLWQLFDPVRVFVLHFVRVPGFPNYLQLLRSHTQKLFFMGIAPSVHRRANLLPNFYERNQLLLFQTDPGQIFPHFHFIRSAFGAPDFVSAEVVRGLFFPAQVHDPQLLQLFQKVLFEPS